MRRSVSSSIPLSSPLDIAGTGYKVTGKGPFAEIDLWWDEEQYPCINYTRAYELSFCLDRQNADCFETVINSTTYKLSSQPSLPVVFWNSYSWGIAGFCGWFVNRQDLFINTGPGGNHREFFIGRRTTMTDCECSEVIGACSLFQSCSRSRGFLRNRSAMQ